MTNALGFPLPTGSCSCHACYKIRHICTATQERIESIEILIILDIESIECPYDTCFSNYAISSYKKVCTTL